MKKAQNVRLSLRKLFTAMLAIGPLAVLPSPVWATLPSSTSFTITQGSATVNSAGTAATITTSDRAILTWGATNPIVIPGVPPVADGNATNFKIDATETYNFVMPAGGSVLNKVISGTSVTVPEAAVIDGTLLSTGKVFVLANGNIRVGGSAVINTAGGLVLSTLTEPSDFPYQVTGNLTFPSGANTRTITIGNGVSAPGITGNLSLYSGLVDFKGATVVGDVIIRTVGTTTPTITNGGAGYAATAPTVAFSAPPAGGTTATGTAVVNTATGLVTGITIANAGSGYTSPPTITLSGGSGAGATAVYPTVNLANGTGTNVTGNLTVITNDPNVAASGLPITGSNSIIVSGLTTLNSGTALVNLANTSNNFSTVVANTTGSVTLADNTDIMLGASTIGGALNVTAVNSIITSGAVATSGAVSLTTTGVAANVTGPISFGSGSSVGGILSASTQNGTISISTVGNLTTGAITAGGGVSSVAVTNGGAGYLSAPTVTVSAPNNAGGVQATATAAVSGGVVTGITIGTAGSGYTSAPTFTITGGGGNAATAASLTPTLSPTSLGSLTIAGGGNYTIAPTISFSGGGGAGAAATATFDTNGKLTGYYITNAGSGYTSPPTVALSGGTLASGQAAPLVTSSLMPTPIASIAVTGGGTGYTGILTDGNATAGGIVVSATQRGGSTSNLTFGSATAAAGVLTGFTTTSTNLYTSVPYLTISGGGVTPATVATQSNTSGSAVAITSNGLVSNSGNVFGSAVSVTAPGVTNTAGTITASGGLTINATAGDLVLPSVVANGITLAATGNISQRATTNIKLDPNANVALSGGNFTINSTTNQMPGAKLALNAATVNLSSSNSTGLKVTNSAVAGDLTLTSTGPILLGTASGTLAETITVGGNFTANVTGGGIGSVAVTNSGNATAAAAAVYSGDLSKITLTVTAAPTGGTTAVLTPVFDAMGRISNVTVTNPGSGYLTAPTVSIALNGQTSTGVAQTFSSKVSGSTITDDSDVTTKIFGPMNLLTNSGNIVLSSQVGSGKGSGTYGQLNANTNGVSGTANVTVHELTTIGVGNVTANLLTLNSTGGNIVFQPTNIPGNATYASSIGMISARASSSGATITQTTPVATTLSGNNSTWNTSGGTILDNVSNSFVTNMTVTNGANNVFVANSSFTLANGTSVTGSNKLSITTVAGDLNTAKTVTIQGGNATNVTVNSVGEIKIQASTFANLTLSATNLGGNASAITQSGVMTTNGTLTVSAVAGAVNLASTNNNTIGTVVIGETPGGISLSSQGNLTLRGATSGTLTATAGAGNSTQGTYAAPYTIALGNLSAGSLTLEAKNGNNNLPSDGVSGAITQQTGTTLRSENAITATTFGGNIVLANSGNSFGQINLSTGVIGTTPNGGTISMTERDTMKIGSISTAGAVTLTSAFGGIIEDPLNVVSLTAGSLTANAAAGSILLGDTTHTAGATSGVVLSATLNAGGAAAIQSTGNLTLGASAANSLIAKSGDTLTQSGPLSIYGSANFTAPNGITLTDAANNFGPVALTVTAVNKNISIVENNTLNLRTVSFPNAVGNGTFSATSLNGDIIDTGLSGVVPGGRSTAIGTGVVTLSAVKGNITIDDPTSDFATTGGVLFNANNATLSVIGTSSLVLGAAGATSAVTGNLTVTSATGSILNAGTLTVPGVATFQTGPGSTLSPTSISLPLSGNSFGSLRFAGNQVSISQVNDMKILTGSSAVGASYLSSGGNITISNVGGVVAFANTAMISAAGSITLPKLVQAVGTITVNAPGTKDLSALSLSGDLSSKAPVSFGSGTYLPPLP